MKERKLKKAILYALVLTLGLATEQAKADFTISEPTNLGPIINSPDQEHAANISADGLSLFLTSDRSGGFGSDDIWVTTRTAINDPWSEPANLELPVNSFYPDGYPSISADGLTLYFSANNRPGGPGGPDLWMTTRATKSDPWQEPVNLGSPVNSAGWEVTESISADGLSLYFDSDRPGGSGDFDLWVTTRATTKDNWGTPVSLGPTINSSSLERGPSISSDGSALFFESDRPGGFGSRDIWMTIRATKDGSWNEPVNLGPTVNTARWEKRPNISAGGRTLYFSSYDRPGGYGHYDIWQAVINPIVDINGDGVVNGADMCIMVDHWGTDNSLCDIGPMPWGDGIVNVEDLKVLAEHLFEDYRLIHHWLLDESEGSTAHDSVGDKDAVLYGNPLWQPSAGRINGALALDGENDYLRTPFILDPASGSFSVFAWIKGGAPGQMIISQRDVVNGRTTNPGNTWLMADSSYGRLMTRLMHPPFPPLLSESVITDNQWHHIGLVFDIITLHRYLYVDGIEVAKDGDLVGGEGSDGGLYIGADKTLNPASFFSGLIDDVRIYDNVLTEEEIAALTQ